MMDGSLPSVTAIHEHIEFPAYLLADSAGVADVWWPFSAGVARYTHKLTGAQTDGRLFQVLVTTPQGAAMPLHVHRDADETLYILDGELTYYIGDTEIPANAGDSVFIPRGCAHTFLVRSEQARMLVTFGPAGVEGFFCGLGSDARRSQLPTEAPDPELFAAVADRYQMDILGPPPTLD
jgi:quercetin dioxygenase-like cupin family protein